MTTDTSSQSATTLVLGGNGKTGRRIVERLTQQGRSVRVGSRSGTPAFDWHDSSNWDEVLNGVDRMYIAYYPDLAVPSAPEHIRELVALAKEKNLQKLVLLSVRGGEEARLCEQIVMNSGIPSTLVRCAWFNQNFSESFFHDMVMAGTIALPIGEVREPFVDADDIADVAVAALSSEGYDGQIYEITGPRLMSFAEVAQEITTVTGTKLKYVEIPRAEFVAGLEADGLPAEMVQLIDYLFSVGFDGRNESLGDGVQRALGREPKDFRDFARSTHANGGWGS